MGSTYKDSYESRNNGPDKADLLMQSYLQAKGYEEYKDYLRIGTDPKVNKLDLFWYATDILLVPDYIVVEHGYIWFVEVKGTLRLKASDFHKIMEMHWKGCKYKEVKVGLFYFKNPHAEPKWFHAEKIHDLWIDPRTEEGYYPEKDVDGKAKLYRVLPSV